MTENNPQQIVFIDSRVPDIQDLLDGLQPDEQAFVLDPSSDGVQQIADILAENNFSDLSSISIVSHGESGTLDLGSSVITDANLANHSSALAEIGASLAPGGTIQLYGCDVAQGTGGQQFIEDFSTFAGGAEVDASTQPVGSPASGGSWTLNASSVPALGAPGVNGANAPFTGNALANFQGTLGPAAASDPELWIASDLLGGDIVHVDDVAGSATNTTTLYAGNTKLTDIQGVVLDPTDQLYFVLVQNANSGEQILEGSLTQALNTPGATPVLTTVFTDSNVADFIPQIALDTVNHQIYFVDDFNLTTGTNNIEKFERVNYNGGSLTTLATVAAQSGGPTVEVTGFALDLTNHDAVFTANQGGTISFTHTTPPSSFLYEATGVTSAATSVAISQLPIGGAGTFTLNPSLGFFDNAFPGGIAIDPTTHKLYFTLENGDTGGGLFEYNLTSNPNGSLTTIWQQTAAGPTGAPNALVIDPTTGEYFIAFDGGTNSTADQYNGVWRGLLTSTAAPTAFLTTPTFPTNGNEVALEFSLDQQPTLSITATNPTFTESALNPASLHNTPVALVSSAAASDPDNDALVNAAVTIGSFFAGDTLTFSNNNNVTGSYNSSTGVLTFSGVDSFAHYQTALESVDFTSTSDNPTDYGSDTSRTLTWVVNDGLVNSASQTETVTVVGINDPPTLSNVATGAQFTEEGGAVTLSGAVTVTDPDDLKLSSATVSITGGRFTNDGDILGFVTAGTSITASYDSTNERLTLSGSDTLAHYQQVLDSVTFNDGENPTNYGSNTTRTVTWVAVDPSGTANGGQDTSGLSTTTVSITNVNDPPTLSNVATSAHYTEEAGAVTLSGAVSITDPDSLDLVSATVAVISGTFANDGDVLAASTAGTGITASYNSTTETLTLSGSDTLANYQSVLDTVTFTASENPTDFGSDPTRQVSWLLNDGGGTANGGSQVNSPLATTTVSITNVNDPPTLGNVATGAQFTEEGGAVTLSGALSVTDPDDLNLSSATVSITGGRFTNDGDILGFVTAGTSILASYNSSTETLTLSGTDTLAHYQQVLDSVAFNDGENPTNYGSNTTRLVTWQVMDPSGTANGGSDVNSPINTTTVTITNVNDPPTLSNVATSAHYTEEAGAVTLSGAVSVTDPDNLDLVSATVAVISGTFANDGDVLAANTAGTSITASYNSTTETLTLSGSDTLANYQSVLDTVTFTASENPTDYGSNPTRQVTWLLNDGGGTANGGSQVNSPPATTTVSVTNINDPPTLSNVASAVTATASVVATLSPSVTVSDPDNLSLASATVQITGGTFAGDDDVLAATAVGNVTVSYNTSSETLTLSGSDTLAHYQSVLDTVTFETTAADPTDAGADPTRTVSWVLDDGSGSNNLSTPQFTTINLQQGPAIAPAALASWTEETPAATLSSALALSDTNGSILLSATVALAGADITNGTFTPFGQATGDLLTANTSGTSILASYNSTTETLTLSGSDTVADYRMVLDTVAFSAVENPTNYGSDPTRTVTWTVNDGASSHSSASATSTIDVVNVNDPPTLGNVATSDSFTQGGGAVSLAPGASVTDPDDLTLVSATVSIAGGTFAGDGDVLTTDVTGLAITASYNSTTETLTLTGTDTLADYQHALDSVAFSSTSQNPTDYGSDPTRTVTWVLKDPGGTANGGQDTSALSTTTVSITAVNNPPTLSNVATSQSFTEEGGAVTLSGAVAVSDPDNLDLASATVRITGGTFANDGDVLAATTAGTAILASYNSTTETLTLSGSDTLAHYRGVLDTVTFNAGENPNDFGSNPSRQVTWVLNDGSASNNLSTAVTSTVGITNVNDPPTLASVATSAHFTQGAGATTLASALSVADPDDLDLKDATVAITGGTFANDGDVLAATITGTAILASYNSSTETLTLSGTDTLAHYQQVLDSITFNDTSLNPTQYGSALTRTVTWVVQDPSGTLNGGMDTSALATTTVSVTNVNDPPTLGNVATSQSFTEAGGAVTLSGAVAVSDPDNLSLAGATVKITGGTFAGDGDVLAATTAGTAILASYNSTTETLTLSGSDTLAHYQGVLDTVTFNAGQNPTDFGSDPTRTVTWVLNDGGASNNLSTAVTTTVSVTNLSHPPTLGNVATSQQFTEAAGAVTLAGAVAVTDPDNLTLASATVSITGGTFANDQDMLAANTTGTSITASYNSSTETLTLSGADTLAHYQGVLDTVTFNDTSLNPTDYGSNPTRQVSWVLNNGSASNNLSTAVTTTVSVTGVNNPPVFTLLATSVNISGANAITPASAVRVNDPDDLTLASATVAITGGTFAGDGDVLTANISGTGITASYNAATETLTLTGADTPAHYTQVLESIRFQSTAADPTNGGADPTRTLTWTAQDPHGATTSATETLAFAPNPPPPAGTTQVMIMDRGSTGTYEIYDLGNSAILGAQELGQINPNLQEVALAPFNGGDLNDMLMRDQTNGEFWMDDISGNTITRVTDMGNVGLSWQVLGFGNFSGNAGETDMLMRDTSTGNLELYDIANGQFTGFHNMQNIGTSWQVLGFGDFSGNAGESDMLMRDSATGNLELYDITQNGYTGFHNMQNIGTSWQVLGFGDFSGNAGESDMLMRDSATGNLELYDITNNQYTGFHNMQNIGTSWQVLGFGDFSGNAGESDMLMRDSATGNVELYDINHNQYTGFFALGNIALAWSVVAFGDFSGNAGEADMLMRNTNTGEFELYDITNNTITNKIDLGNVGPEWAAIGVADPPAPGQSSASTSQLTQAMAAFAPASSALATAAPLDPTPTPAGAANPLGTPMPTPRLGAA